MQATKYIQSSLEMAQRLFGPHNPEVGNNHHSLGVLYAKQGRHKEALNEYENAVNALVLNYNPSAPFSNPPLKDILSEIYLINVWDGKGEAYLGLAEAAKDSASRLAHTDAALASFEQGVALIDSMRLSYKTEGSKFLVGEKHFLIYEKAIYTALALNPLTKASHFDKTAFTYSEKAKTAVLHQALQETKARHFAEIPDDLLQQEKEIKIELARRNSEMLQLRQAGNDSLNVADLEDKYFKLSQQYRYLLAQLETHYPRYYDLKYRRDVVSVPEVQKALDEKTALIEYFVGDSTLYAFVITQEDFQVTRLPLIKNLEEKIEKLLCATTAEQFKTFAETSYELHQALVQPIADKAARPNWIITPDGPLNHLPFEMLVTKLPLLDTSIAYDSLSYLLSQHSISYAYSATLWLEGVNHSKPVAEHDLLAFAPEFKKSFPAGLPPAGSYEFCGRLDSTRSMVSELHSNKEEVEQIAELFEKKYDWWSRVFGKKTKVLTGATATERTLKSLDLNQYRYIHFSTHGAANRSIPDLSWILFTPGETPPEDNVLFLPEIYNLDLNARLVVVSACETGAGKISRGEGILGLARGFLYAGARNLLVSLWKVKDPSTARLMQEFYSRLLAGESEAVALQQAKLAMLKQTEFYRALFFGVGL